MELRDIALQYHAWGANVTAIGGSPDLKRPAHRWQQFTTARQTVSAVRGLPWTGYTRRDATRVDITGVGFISGVNGWRDLDFDKCPDFAPVAQALAALGLPAAYPWVQRTGSGAGWQIIFVCQAELPAGALTAKAREPGVFVGVSRDGAFNHLELRWANCQSLLPPSQHESGGVYRWRGDAPTASPSAVSSEQALAAFQALAEPRSRAPAANSQRAARELVSSSPSAPDDRTSNADRQIIDAIHERFDLLAYARQHFPGEQLREGDEVRITGHGGLLLKPEAGVWFCHRETIGGDWLDLVGYRQHGSQWARQDKVMFRAALGEAAAFAGVSLACNSGHAHARAARPALGPEPVTSGNGHHAMSAAQTAPGAGQRTDHPALADQLAAPRAPVDDRPEPPASPDAPAPDQPHPTATAASPLPAESDAAAAPQGDLARLLATLSAATDRAAVMTQALAATGAVARLDRTDQLRVEQALRQLGVTQEFVRQWRTAVNAERKRSQPAAGEPPPARASSWPYEATEGRLWLLSRTLTGQGEELIQRTPICDFTAQVLAEEVTELEGAEGLGAGPPAPAEERQRWFTLQGVTLSGKMFSARLAATTLGDPRALRTALLSVIGSEGIVYPRMDAAGSDTVTKPDYITVIEAKEKIYLPLVLRAAP